MVVPGAKALQRWPGYPAAARAQSRRAASGRGTTAAACAASGVGEAVELASCCAWGDEPTWRARPAELERAFAPATLLGLSPPQVADRGAWNARHGWLDWRPAPCPPERPIDWVVAEDADGAAIAVPADFVYIGRREPGDEEAAAVADSNGCAAAPTPAGARLAALLELVERDATGRWWYGQRARPSLPLALLDAAPGLRSAFEARQRRTLLLDITTDLGVPCVAAISSEPDGTRVGLGFAAAPDPSDAACAAATEMVQTELALRAATALADPGPPWRDWLAEVDMTLPVLAAAGPPAAPPDPLDGATAAGAEGQLDALLVRCARSRCRVAFVDLTRPEFGVPVARALSPDLCHCRPRFGFRRLLATDRRDLRPPPSAPRPNLRPLAI